MMNLLRERVRKWAEGHTSRHVYSQLIRSASGTVVILRYNVFDFGPLHIRIHRLVGSDHDRGLHTHPWYNATWVLDGEYWEIVPCPHLKTTISPITGEYTCRWVKSRFGEAFCSTVLRRCPGDLVLRTPRSAHRITLVRNRPALTLFVHWNWGRGRRWGFWSEVDGSYSLVEEDRK
ncbi:MAG: hypothetical protein KGL39_03475 [Patescibacteria group bacterium]|nr:hypothetical protein [Patescibacteria group bacterium]